MGIKQVQANFSYGELDPKLLCRPDFTGYYKGARKLRNVLCIPQGGVKRRFGSKYGFTVVDTGDANEPVTNIDEIRTVIFDFSLTKSFLIVVRPHDRTGTASVAFDIYQDDSLQSTEVTTDYTIAQIQNLNFVRAQDRVIILHNDVAPHQLVRGANDFTWDLTAISFTYSPVYDFSIKDGSPNYRTPFPAIWNVSATTGNAITITVNPVPIGMFNAGHVGGLITGGGGVARITAVASALSATARVVTPFSSTGPFFGNDTLLQSVAWGNFTSGTPAGGNRGFPSVGSFFQNRLVLGNSTSLPNVIWASNIDDYYNFNTELGDDLNGFAIGIGANGNETVQGIVGTKALVVLGASGVYASSLFIDLPITPSNAFLSEQARDGATGIPAQIVDNQIFYVDENNQQIRSATYDIGTSSFNIFDVSVFSPHLIFEPVSTAALRPQNDSGSYYMVVNSDGTLAAFQSLKDQSVNAWTLNEMRGSIYAVTASRGLSYLTVRRCVTTGATVSGFADNIYTANVNFDAITSIKISADSPISDVPIFSAVSDYVIIGHEIPFYILAVSLNTPSSATIAPTFEYLNKLGAWQFFTPTDATSGFTVNGNISWVLSTDMVDWAPMDIEDNNSVHLPLDSINGTIPKFWIRIRRTASSLVTTPIEDTLKINIGNRVYLESINFDEHMDCVKITTSNSSGLVTGLSHLVGQQVYVLADTVPEGPYFVPPSGEITIKGLQSTNVHVGINFIPEIIPMPIVVVEQNGINIFQEKLIKAIYVYFYESLGILVNGQEIPTLKVGQLVLDQAPIPITDFYQVTPRRGWNPTAENIISQNLPLPFTIIGIGYIVEAS